jgi:hypothetical protein
MFILPSRTALTIAALRRATQRFVSGGGRPGGLALMCGKSSPQG